MTDGLITPPPLPCASCTPRPRRTSYRTISIHCIRPYMYAAYGSSSSNSVNGVYNRHCHRRAARSPLRGSILMLLVHTYS
uniref:Uncharacterized protein n=1 Tax=Trichogramma kaykai TaxID=54128 RepID=A0ABD2XD68_9HYME